jgi:hypothetical protein
VLFIGTEFSILYTSVANRFPPLKFSKVLYIVALYRKYTRVLTFEKFGEARRSLLLFFASQGKIRK